MKMTYTGSLLNAGGQFARIENLPLTALLNGGAVVPIDYPSGAPVSVNDLFRYATQTGRIDALPLEQVHRPDDSAHIFRSDLQSPVVIDPLDLVLTTPSETALAQQPQWFGFAWRGLPAGVANPLVYEMYKTVEWRAEPNSGLTGVAKRTMYPSSQVPLALNLLDKVTPNWTSHSTAAATKLRSLSSRPEVRQLGKFIAQGAGNYINRRMTNPPPRNQLALGYDEIVGPPRIDFY
jgi:hypothetical protein